MPRKTLKQLAGNSNQQKMKKYKIDEGAKESKLDKNYFLRSDGLVNEYDYFDFNNNLEDLPENEKNCQASVMHSTKSTQTDFDFNCNISNYKNSLSSKLNWEIICELADMLREYMTDWNFIHERVFSVIICMIFKLMSVKYEETSKILFKLDCLNIKHTLKWCQSIVENDDLKCVFEDKRGTLEKLLSSNN